MGGREGGLWVIVDSIPMPQRVLVCSQQDYRSCSSGSAALAVLYHKAGCMQAVGEETHAGLCKYVLQRRECELMTSSLWTDRSGFVKQYGSQPSQSRQCLHSQGKIT